MSTPTELLASGTAPLACSIGTSKSHPSNHRQSQILLVFPPDSVGFSSSLKKSYQFSLLTVPHEPSLGHYPLLFSQILPP